MSTDKKEVLFKDDFFIPHPAELYPDLKTGKISPLMWTLYSIILKQADYETGVWNGCAEKLQFALGGKPSERTIQVELKRLSEQGYLKSFYQKGKNGNYPVLIHNYCIRFGKLTGYRLDASATTDVKNPVYVRGDVSASRCDEQGSPKPQRSVSASRCGDQRSVSAASPHPIATIPDYPEYPDCSFPEPSNHPDAQRSEWLEDKLKAYFLSQTGTAMLPTMKEVQRLDKLAEEHGELDVLLAFAKFVERQRGFSGLGYPLTVFCQEFQEHLAVAGQEIKDSKQYLDNPAAKGFHSRFQAVSNIMAEYGYSDDQEQRLRLTSVAAAYKHDEMDEEYNVDIVREYLERNPAPIGTATEDQEQTAAA
jgi:hypothetical protein